MSFEFQPSRELKNSDVSRNPQLKTKIRRKRISDARSWKTVLLSK